MKIDPFDFFIILVYVSGAIPLFFLIPALIIPEPDISEPLLFKRKVGGRIGVWVGGPIFFKLFIYTNHLALVSRFKRAIIPFETITKIKKGRFFTQIVIEHKDEKLPQDIIILSYRRNKIISEIEKHTKFIVL